MAYTFDSIFAADPSNAANVASNAAITIYDPADATKAPVALTDVTDLPITNPVTVNKNGFGPAFKHATLDRLAWSGGGFEGFFTSYEGIKNEAVAARQAAETAEADTAIAVGAVVTTAAVNGSGKLILTRADATTVDAGSVIGPKGDKGDKGDQGLPGVNAVENDTAIAGYINATSSATKTALSATYAPKAGVAVASSSVYLQRYPKAKATALSRFHAGLAGRRTAPCDWVQIGDSITEGQGATARDFRYATRARDLLRAEFPTAGVAGGANYRTANPIVSSYPKDPPGAFTSDFRFGLGKRSVQLASGTPLVFTEYGTSFKIGAFRDTGTGSFSYSVDGGAAVTVNTAGAHLGEFLTTISGLTAGQHTISISLVSGYVLINGLYVYYGDESAGIRTYESGHFGYKASDFISTPSGGTATDWLTSVTNIQPHLVTIELGANDAVSQSAATYKANMQTLITNVKAAITTAPSIVLVAFAARSDTLVESWANYVTAMKEIAAADATVDVLDLTTILPAVSGAASGWYADTVHPANKAHNEMARALVEFITP